MEIEIPQELLDRAARWGELKRWERRELAQALRLLGLSYREIGKYIPASKGSLSPWCRDIPLTPAQIGRLRSLSGNSEVGRAKTGATLRARNLDRIRKIRDAGKEEARLLVENPFWVVGVVAYWAEGSKRINRVHFSNSDPQLIVLLMQWAMRFLDISIDRFRIALHLHRGQDEMERKQFWSVATGVPLKQFQKSFIKPEGSGHRKNILYNGTASVLVTRSTDLLHRVMGWIDFVSENQSKIR